MNLSTVNIFTLLKHICICLRIVALKILKLLEKINYAEHLMPIGPTSTMYTYASLENILFVFRLFMMTKGPFHSLWHLRDNAFYLAQILHIIVLINKLLIRGIMLSSLGGSNWVSIVCIHMKICVIVSFENYHLPFSHFFWR